MADSAKAHKCVALIPCTATMKKVSDYNLACYVSPSELEKFVQSYIHVGWELFGPPFQVQGGVCQALIKTDEAQQSAVVPSTLKND